MSDPKSRFLITGCPWDKEFYVTGMDKDGKANRDSGLSGRHYIRDGQVIKVKEPKHKNHKKV